MRTAWAFAFFILAYFPLWSQSDFIVEEEILPEDEIVTPTDGEIAARLRQMSLCVTPRFTSEVKGYIRGYTERHREKTEKMLSRTLIYFPIFDKYFADAGIPKDLRNLSVVESALEPLAVSHAGAVGLWQFMRETGSRFGLESTSYTDERRDPHKATQAAIAYLKELYAVFDDWALAIAAYNSGPTRINNAIKRSRSNNFWRIRKYLPKETQNYVPAFIAANYILQFYKEHNLRLDQPNLDLQITGSAKVYKSISFPLIASVTALPLMTIRQLNPTFSRDYVPANNDGGYNLVLPQRVLAAFKDYLGNPDNRPATLAELPGNVEPERSPADPDGNYIKSIYLAEAGDNLASVAQLFNCSVENLRAWNNLSSANLSKGQELTVYVPREIRRFRADGATQAALEEADNEAALEAENAAAAAESRSKARKTKKYLYYQIKRNETLSEIAEKYSGVSLKTLLRLNNIKNTRAVRAGTRIKLKELD